MPSVTLTPEIWLRGTYMRKSWVSGCVLHLLANKVDDTKDWLPDFHGANDKNTRIDFQDGEMLASESDCQAPCPIDLPCEIEYEIKND